MVMQATAGEIRKHQIPSLPVILEAAREKLTREKIAEAAVIATTVALMMVLSSAFLLGLERYTIAGF
jgi:hypothetical protein